MLRETGKTENARKQGTLGHCNEVNRTRCINAECNGSVHSWTAGHNPDTTAISKDPSRIPIEYWISWVIDYAFRDKQDS